METNMMVPVICRGCRWGQVGVWACYYKPADPDDLVVNRTAHADFYGTCPAFEAGQPKPPPKPSRSEQDRAKRAALRARAEAAEAEVKRLRGVITKAVDDLPEWSAGALKYASPAEVMADEVRTALRAAVTR